MSSPTTSYIRPLAAMVAMAALLVAYSASPARAEGACSTTAATETTCTFDTPGTSAWTVPTGVTQATFDVFGAQGGSQGSEVGGLGGEATATISVTPGETLQVNVGGKGGDGAGGGGGVGGGGGAGGFNGGAAGGDGCCDGPGGGGGASDVRRDTNASGDFALASRIIVAGGGGGRGGFSTRGGSAGGVGGGPSGGDGTGGSYGIPALDGAPGAGGTQVAGGAGGGPAEPWGVPGSTGALGTGGAGGAGLGITGDGGGGGGGGYYGGGGGGGGQSAGGGGGGSGFGPNGVVFQSGVRSGDGLVTIRYTTPDTTPPTLSVGHTADGSNGWNKTSPVTLNVSASDPGSGLAGAPTCTDGTTSLALTAGSTAGTWTAGVSGEGSHTISCSVTDNAGIRKSATDTVNIDTKAPTISDLGPTTQPNAAGWYNTDVTNRFRATDSLSGVNVSGLNAACVAAFPTDQAGENVQSKTTSGEGSSVKVTSDDCTDVAGNTAKRIDSATFQIDTTAPTIVASAKKADGSAYTAGAWSNQSVTVSYTCSDGTGSGVASCPADQTFSEDGADQSASGTATDNAGNTASASFGDIDIDRTKPRVTCDVASPGPTFVLGGAGGNVKATVADETSGPVATSLSGAATVSSVGNKSVSLTGSDNAGNTTTLSCPYTVKYSFLGPFSPIPLSSYQAGSTIPVKFALADAAGSRISDAAARTLVASPCKVKVSFNGGTKNCATYNATTDTFQYDQKVPKNLSSGSYKIIVEVSAPDGSGVVNKESVEVKIKR